MTESILNNTPVYMATFYNNDPIDNTHGCSTFLGKSTHTQSVLSGLIHARSQGLMSFQERSQWLEAGEYVRNIALNSNATPHNAPYLRRPISRNKAMSGNDFHATPVSIGAELEYAEITNCYATTLQCYSESSECATYESALILETEHQSPYRLATTLDEVERILALQDGSIPVTNLEIPAILNGEVFGIIITEQNLNDAFEVLLEAYILYDYVIHNLVTTSVRFSEWDYEQHMYLMANRTRGISDFLFEIVDAAAKDGLLEVSGGIYPEVFERIREEARRVLALYEDSEWPSSERAHESAWLLFGN
jgi:hypothetical protein